MKTAKKSAVLLLALAMVFAFFGLTASAEELTFGDYTYVVLDDGSVKITAYNGTETAVTVPDTIEEKAVTVIGAGAFDQKETIESLVIPGSVAELETGAVSFCPKLEGITVQEGQLQQIGLQHQQHHTPAGELHDLLLVPGHQVEISGVVRHLKTLQ